MITIENFLENKKDIQSCGKYKKFVYEDPEKIYRLVLGYSYLFGWGCSVDFLENSSITLSINNEEDAPVEDLLKSINKCILFFEKIKKGSNDSVGFTLDDFNHVHGNYYEYGNSDSSFFVKIIFNGIDNCIIEVFLGRPGKKGVSAFFNQDTINQAITVFNRRLIPLVNMYNDIKD